LQEREWLVSVVFPAICCAQVTLQMCSPRDRMAVTVASDMIG
jgi:hypothetical protein